MTDEMDHPVTRRELREELASYPTRKELHEALEIWGGAIKSELRAEMAEMRTEMRAGFAAQSTEIAQQIRASEERMRDFLRALMDPHHGVPGRVTGLEARVDRLEAKVLVPKRTRRRPSR